MVSLCARLYTIPCCVGPHLCLHTVLLHFEGQDFSVLPFVVALHYQSPVHDLMIEMGQWLPYPTICTSAGLFSLFLAYFGFVLLCKVLGYVIWQSFVNGAPRGLRVGGSFHRTEPCNPSLSCPNKILLAQRNIV